MLIISYTIDTSATARSWPFWLRGDSHMNNLTSPSALLLWHRWNVNSICRGSVGWCGVTWSVENLDVQPVCVCVEECLPYRLVASVMAMLCRPRGCLTCIKPWECRGMCSDKKHCWTAWRKSYIYLPQTSFYRNSWKAEVNVSSPFSL